jgi:hypothetical protein
MWPKVLAQLIPQMLDLLPHLKRVVPMAEKFLSSKAEADRANEAALVTMAEGVRGDLGQMASAHAGLYRKLMEVDAQIGEVGTETKRARMSVEAVEARMGGLEKAIAGYRTLAITALVMLAVVLILVVLVYLRVGVGR